MEALFKRKKTRQIRVGNLIIGGGAPVSVQSMTNTDTHDYEATRAQILALQEAGCDIVRLALPDLAAVETVKKLKEEQIGPPLVGDIHYDYRIALAAAKAGIDKIRINPGNIGARERVAAVAEACASRHIPIRIGVNGGSLEKSILEKYGAPTPAALAESALYHASLLEEVGFTDILLSVKASDVPGMIAANRILSDSTDYPLHLGVTEAGGEKMGSVKNAIGIGTLLAEGIGDTLRVSLTADPVLEVREGRAILSALHLLQEGGMDIISCPTCGRTRIDLIPLLNAFEKEVDRLSLRSLPIKVAFMGCAVNGLGEAHEADVGIAGGVGEGILFRQGEPVRKVKAEEMIPALLSEILKIKDEKQHG